MKGDDMKKGPGPIYFAGAGPGDPELVTLKTRRLLDEADLIVYAGSLVNPALLDGLEAEIHDSSSMDLDEITGLMASAWRAGKRVVRLHTGDPTIYGAVREQMDRLHALGIPCAIVPGVSSATAAAAAIGAELTVPGLSQTVILTRRAGRTPVPERESLSALAAHQATMCIFLSVSMIQETVDELLAGGYQEDTPAAVVEKATWPEERVIRGTLSDIAEKVKRAGIKKTAMILVGRAVDAKDAHASRLYDPSFSHGFRKGRKEALRQAGAGPEGPKSAEPAFGRHGRSRKLPEKTAILAITKQGKRLAAVLAGKLQGSHIVEANSGIKEAIERAWNRYDALVCIMAAGIVVRAVKDLCQDKGRDPAVVVVSQDGAFALPILSGHIGGANALAVRIAEITGGQAAITTASDVAGRTAIDLWMDRFGLKPGRKDLVAPVMKRLVEKGSLKVFSELSILPPLPEDLISCSSMDEADMIISWRSGLSLQSPGQKGSASEAEKACRLLLHPPVLYVGIGCNRQTPKEAIEECVRQAFKEAGLSMKSICRAASIDLKKDEEGLLQFCEEAGIELVFFSARELNRVPGIKGSKAVMRATGTRAVCEPAALLAAGEENARIIMEKRICRDVTVAAALACSPWWE